MNQRRRIQRMHPTGDERAPAHRTGSTYTGTVNWTPHAVTLRTVAHLLAANVRYTNNGGHDYDPA